MNKKLTLYIIVNILLIVVVALLVFVGWPMLRDFRARKCLSVVQNNFDLERRNVFQKYCQSDSYCMPNDRVKFDTLQDELHKLSSDNLQKQTNCEK